MLTLFAALIPPPDILADIHALQTGIDGIHWVPVENLHITIGYFGRLALETAELLDRELNINPGTGFELQFSGIDTFGGQQPHTLWLGVTPSPALERLHAHVRRAAKRSRVNMESRTFRPHLSLAYPRRKTDKPDLARYLQKHMAYRSKAFLVDEFSLFSSHHNKTGPNTYLKEANYPLLG